MTTKPKKKKLEKKTPYIKSHLTSQGQMIVVALIGYL
jgi:hypothetical protein